MLFLMLLHGITQIRQISCSVYLQHIFTGSIACSARRRYLIYSEADFEVDTLHRWGKTWYRGRDQRYPPPRQVSPHRRNDKGIGPPKLKFLLRFNQNVEYKRPAGAHPSRDFNICRVCIPRFRMRQLLKFRWIR